MAAFWLQILGTSVGAISQVALVCAVGFCAGLFPRTEPILARSFVKRLATLSMVLFEPCLAFYVFSSRLSYSTLMIYWIVPLWQMPVAVVNYLYGRLLTSLACSCGLLRHSSEKDRTLVKVIPLVCTFQNAIAFVLPIFASLCESRAASSMPYRALSASDASIACTTDTALFSFMFFIVWSLIFWMWGYPKLATLTHATLASARVDAGDKCISSSASSIETQGEDRGSALLDDSQSEILGRTNDDSGTTPPCNTPEPEVIGSVGLRHRSGVPASGLHTEVDDQVPSESDDWTSPDFQQSWQEWIDDSASGFAGGAMVDWSLFSMASTSSSYFDDTASVATATSGFTLDMESLHSNSSSSTIGQKISCCSRCRQWMQRRVFGFYVLLKVFSQPALAATFAGIACGLIGYPRQALFEHADSPLRPVGRAIHMIGQPGPLIGMLVMSASLAASIRERKAKGNDATNSSSSDGIKQQDEQHTRVPHQMPSKSTSKWVGLVIALIPLCVRSLLSPATGLFLVYGCLRLQQNKGLLGSFASVVLPPHLPWLHLCIVLQWAAPPGQTIVVACARLGLGEVASGLARMYLVFYLIGMGAVTVVSTVALSLLFETN